MKVSEVVRECRAEAKKHGLTFKEMSSCRINGATAYKYVTRATGLPVRINLTLGLAYEIACSGELGQNNEK